MARRPEGKVEAPRAKEVEARNAGHQELQKSSLANAQGAPRRYAACRTSWTVIEMRAMHRFSISGACPLKVKQARQRPLGCLTLTSPLMHLTAPAALRLHRWQWACAPEGRGPSRQQPESARPSGRLPLGELRPSYSLQLRSCATKTLHVGAAPKNSCSGVGP